METDDNTDMSKYGSETRIFSADGKYQIVFTDKELLEKINKCNLPFSLYNLTKDYIFEVENILLPLKSRAESLFIESKGGSVVSKMTLEDYFTLLDLEKRIEISDRFLKANPLGKEIIKSIDQEIQDFLHDLDNKH